MSTDNKDEILAQIAEARQIAAEAMEHARGMVASGIAQDENGQPTEAMKRLDAVYERAGAVSGALVGSLEGQDGSGALTAAMEHLDADKFGRKVRARRKMKALLDKGAVKARLPEGAGKPTTAAEALAKARRLDQPDPRLAGKVRHVAARPGTGFPLPRPNERRR
jgi:hypothetical protein